MVKHFGATAGRVVATPAPGPRSCGFAEGPRQPSAAREGGAGGETPDLTLHPAFLLNLTTLGRDE